MKLAKEPEQILDECLEAILSGRQDPREGCSRLDQPELERLLELALSCREALATHSATEANLKEKLLSQLQPHSARRLLMAPIGHHRLTWRRWQVVALTTLAALLMGGTSLATAAGPENILYPLKQRLEDTRTVLAVQRLDQAKAELGHAEKRLDELHYLIEQNHLEPAPDLLANYDRHIDNALRLCREAAAEGEDTAAVEQRIAASLLLRQHVIADMNPGLDEDEQEEEKLDPWPESHYPAAAPGDTVPPITSSAYPADDSDAYAAASRHSGEDDEPAAPAAVAANPPQHKKEQEEPASRPGHSESQRENDEPDAGHGSAEDTEDD